MHFNIPHNTEEWFEIRAGLATASCFDKIITLTGKLSSQSENYADRIIAELLLNRPIERELKLYALEWGNAHEDDARNLYAFETGFDVEPGGFFIDDTLTFGASPDARVFKNGSMYGLAEIKCPENAAVHVEFLLSKTVNPKYKPQVYGQMNVSDADIVDWFSYYPGMPSNRITTCRDDDPEFMKRMTDALEGFRNTLNKKITRLKELGHFEEIPAKSIARLERKYQTGIAAAVAAQSEADYAEHAEAAQ